jgi:hypothetical protein
MKKFTYNDIFYNTLLASPKYVIAMQSGSLRINDQINQNQEYSSSLNAIEYGGTYNYLGYTGSLAHTSSIGRSFIYAPLQVWNYQYTQYSDVTKISAIKNSLADYKRENNFADINYYLLYNGIPNLKYQTGQAIDITDSVSRANYFIRPSCSINLLEIPRDFYGNYVKPGSVQLNMYVSGVLAASAIDSQNNGKLIQSYGGTTGSVVGSVLYDHGLILLTGSESLSNQQAPYIQPLSNYTSSASPIGDYLKWIYFGSYYATTSSAPETKYELIFEGANFIPTLTMMCHAEKNELYWSNNSTFIENGQGDEIFNGQSTSSTDLTGSTYYSDEGSILIPSLSVVKESKVVTIKNTISSSFVHYSASYEPQVFISQIGIYDDEKNLIGIAKLANPVRKTKDLDYTFKLKLDF